MASFPLAFVPNRSWHEGGRQFGASRASGRRHAGCDLIAPVGTPIYAIESGVVVRDPYEFYHGTHALEVRHGTRTVRYGEIRNAAPGVRKGSIVHQGQVIAYVGRMLHSSMLHFELYSGTGNEPLTQRGHPPYQRRADLVDPTSLLDAARHDLPAPARPMGDFNTGVLGVRFA